MERDRVGVEIEVGIHHLVEKLYIYKCYINGLMW